MQPELRSTLLHEVTKAVGNNFFIKPKIYYLENQSGSSTIKLF